MCAQTPVCNGVEFSAASGHCEMWTRPIGYTVAAPGATGKLKLAGVVASNGQAVSHDVPGHVA
eukprot:14288897-Alexandrium_andersonii.AAC.1